MLDSITYRQSAPQRLDAFPTPVNPFAWAGVVETSKAFYVLPVNVIGPGLDPQDTRVFHKSQPSPALHAALATRTARVFMDFAQIPWSQVVSTGTGYTVIVRDLRFQSAIGRRGGFAIRIQLDHEMHVRSQEFDFSGRFKGD
jgi:hypothetical protein